jgi:nicotinamide mononucleotide transporter
LTLTEFIKSELNGWKRLEIIALTIVFITIFTNAALVKDNPIAVISAICGILYSTIAGKGKISCYFFGVMGSACYGYLSWKSALYGNLLLYVCYYIPMQILGIFQWKKNLNKNTNEIIKTALSQKALITVTAVSLIACLVTIFILKSCHDGNCVIDGITTVLSVVGMFLTVKRNIEQWVVWIIVNGLSLIMWINIVIHGMKAYSTVIMWAVYFVLAIYFYIQWNKELKTQKNL